MTITQDLKGKIVTQDSNNKKIYIGELVVKEKEGLREFRDFLMKYPNDELVTYKFFGLCDSNGNFDLSGIRSLVNFGYFRDSNSRDFNSLIHQYPVLDTLNDFSFNYCTYRRDIIYPVFLNSILIFSSLLGDLDGSDFGPLVQHFIGTGIFNCHPFDEVWPRCSKNLATKCDSQLSDLSDYKKNILNIMEMMRLSDFDVFCSALEKEFIEYQIERELLRGDSSYQATFSSLNPCDLCQVMYNNALLLRKKDPNLPCR